MKLLTETLQKDIAFTLSCYDRILISGGLQDISFSQGMTSVMTT